MFDHRLGTGDGGEAARLLVAARARIHAAAADLAVPAPLRLTEWQRSTVASLLERLVRGIEDELRSHLAESLAGEEGAHASLSSAHVAIALPILQGSEILRDPELVGVLLRRAEEHRLHRQMEGAAERGLLSELVGDSDEAVSGAAMAVLIAQGSRFDEYQGPAIGRPGLAADLQHRLVWAVAAALRHYLTARHDIAPAAADAAIAAAAQRLLAGYDEGATMDSLCLRLARGLHDREALPDALVARTLTEVGLPPFLAALAVRAGISPASAWDLVSEPSGRGTPLLLRAAGIERAGAAAILLALSGGAPEDVASGLDLFDAAGPAEAMELLRLWQADPSYRAAIASLAQAA